MIKITRYIYYIIQKLIVRLAFDKSIVSNIKYTNNNYKGKKAHILDCQIHDNAIHLYVD